MQSTFIYFVKNLGYSISVLLVSLLSLLLAFVAITVVAKTIEYNQNLSISLALFVVFAVLSSVIGLCAKCMILDFIKDAKEH